MRTMRPEMRGKRAKTAGSWPGTSNRDSLTIDCIRRCVRRFETASSVGANVRHEHRKRHEDDTEHLAHRAYPAHPALSTPRL